MLSEALQRNAKREARLSNISDIRLLLDSRNPRFFAPLRMTFSGELGLLLGLYHGHQSVLDRV